MGAVIVTYSDSFSIDLTALIASGANIDRKCARIKFHDIRSLTQENDSSTIEIIFTSGEIKAMRYQDVTSVDGVSVTSQQDFYDKMEAVIFNAT